jgi:SAM-dependent methyltransferase
MPEKLNSYGDRLISTSGSHGADIASQRMDDLDRRSLAFILERKHDNPMVCDIGCGLGAQSFRFALLGAQVEMYDIIDINPLVTQFSNLFPHTNIKFFGGDVCDTFVKNTNAKIYAAYSQRTIHYLQYDRSVELFKKIKANLKEGGKFFVSASGLHSELGQGYPGSSCDISARFTKLDSAMAKKHEIREPVCLYTEDDFRRLSIESGFSDAEIWSSPFGNIKAVLG